LGGFSRAVILLGIQRSPDHEIHPKSEEFDIVEISSRGRVRKVRRLGIDELERATRAKSTRTGSRRSTPLGDDDDDEDDDDDLNSNTSSNYVEQVSSMISRTLNG
jgi:hypothetical protein